MSSSWRTDRGVRPSPQVFSLGKCFFSTTTTSQPALGQPVGAGRPGRTASDDEDVVEGVAFAGGATGSMLGGRRAECAPAEAPVVEPALGHGRLSADLRHGGARRPLRRIVSGRLRDARPEETPARREGRTLRVRDRARQGAGGTIPGPLLSRGDDLHHLRHRDRLPLPVGGRLPPAEHVRLRRDPGIRRSGVHLLPVPREQWRTRLGTGEAPASRRTPPKTRTTRSTVVRVGPGPEAEEAA